MKWKLFTFFKFATPRALRLTLVVTVIMLIWHLTLMSSEIPYINSIGSFLSTIIVPFFAIVGCNTIYWFYLKKGNIFGDAAVTVSGGSDFMMGGGEGLLVILGLLLFIILLPVIVFLAPAEVLLGMIYYKHNLWHEIVYAWQDLTWKEGFFVIVKCVLIALTFSFIVWEILAIFVQFLAKVFGFVRRGSNVVQ